jgi:catechol 2,3-dioxygenase-like lactoylglutathione lyase family enzyme
MLLKHVGLTCSSEENADKFYRDLLGLKKSDPKTLASDLSKAIFNIEVQLEIINYMDQNTHFEVFITSLNEINSAQIAHQCLEIEYLSGFIDKCHALGVAVNVIPKGEKTLTFVKDFDGNLFEIKEST